MISDIILVCMCSLVVEHGLPKPKIRVRFPSRAPFEYLIELLIENQSEMIDFSILL